MRYTLSGMADFLKKSVSMYHAAENVCAALRAEGYTELRESGRWQLRPGGRYFTTRNRSSVIAFDLPASGFAPFAAVASHSDSPVFRLKQNAEISAAGKYTLLNAEKYGGGILCTWLDRPLSAAGRVIVRTEKGLETRLIDIGRDICVIPSLAIHMNRDVNDSNKLNAQTDMQALFGDDTAKGGLSRIVAEAAGVKEEDIAGSDLFLYSRVAPSVWGDYISAGRLDDLECAYTSLCAFTEAAPSASVRMYCLFDNEEVGSGTRQGAASTLLRDVYERIAGALGADAEDVRAALASSFLVSADNAHALHPNHPEKADAVNRPYMNEGIVIKFSANQKYTTDGATNAIFAEICRRAGVPVQYFHNRSDSAGGSTLGNIALRQVSVPAVDIGLAQLAMHSSWETAGVKDAEYMAKGLEAVYSSDIRMAEDGNWTID